MYYSGFKFHFRNSSSHFMKIRRTSLYRIVPLKNISYLVPSESFRCNRKAKKTKQTNKTKQNVKKVEKAKQLVSKYCSRNNVGQESSKALIRFIICFYYVIDKSDELQKQNLKCFNNLPEIIFPLLLKCSFLAPKWYYVMLWLSVKSRFLRV